MILKDTISKLNVGSRLMSLDLESTQNLESYSLVNFTRSGTKTYFDSNGTLQTALANTLPVGYEYNSSSGLWEKKGWKIEESRTNLILDSRDLTTGNWSLNTASVTANQVGIDGVSNTAFAVTDDDGASSEFIRQNISVPDNSDSYVCSLFIGKNSSRQIVTIDSFLSGGSSAVVHRLNIDTINGVIQSTINGGSGDADIYDFGDYWHVFVELNNNSTGNTNLTFRFYPAFTNAISNASTVTSETGSAIVDQLQVEQASFPSSPIITEGSQVTRPADVADITDLSWYNQDEGTFVVEYNTNSEDQSIPLNLNDGSGSNNLYLRNESNATQVWIRGLINGTATGGLQLSSGHTVGDSLKVSLFVDGNDIGGCVNGGSVASKTVDSGTFSALEIGNIYTGANELNGYLKSLKYYPKRLSNAKLQSLTS